MLILLWFFIFGTVIGSFLNVVTYRMHTGRSLSGRSHCLSCGRGLSWHELIPVLSWVLRRGRCRACSARVSVQYLSVELVTGALFVLAAVSFWSEWVQLALALAISALLVVIFVYDLRHYIIPDELALALGGLALGWVLWGLHTHTAVLSPLVAFSGWVVPALFLAGLWYASSGRWIGLGDAKLAAPLGLILGFWGGLSMLVLSFWIGAVVSLSLLGLQKLVARGQLRLPIFSGALTMKSEVPFAPFLILGFYAVYLWGADVFGAADAMIAYFIVS